MKEQEPQKEQGQFVAAIDDRLMRWWVGKLFDEDTQETHHVTNMLLKKDLQEGENKTWLLMVKRRDEDREKKV